MKYVYVCPHCKSVLQNESDLPLTALECTQCQNTVLYAKCTLDDWNAKSAEEKEELKTQVILQRGNAMAETDFALLMQMQTMAKDINIIKGIMVFFTVISILGGVIAAVSLF